MADASLCACGSGLRRVRCCALDFATLSPPEAAGLLAPSLTKAEALLAAGDEEGAGAQVRQLLELAPGREDALLFLYRLCRQQGRGPAAEALAELWMGDQRDGLEELRDYYLNRARKAGFLKEGAGFFTDKMPLNEMYLGLISLLFPQSPIIHVLRHPLDVVLSVYSNHLMHGYFCAAQLESIAAHYNLVADLMQHYRQNLAMRYLPVRYEEMVTDQEAQVRKLLEFIGVEFDPRCLSFEKNTRYARTASYAQVAEKLYDRSRYRYRPYLKHLAPVVEVLRPVIERLGYSVEG